MLGFDFLFYFLLILKLFAPSPRNTLDIHLSLLEILDCNIFIVPEGPPPILGIIERIRSRRNLKTLALQPLEDLLNLKDTPRWAYNESFESAVNKPFVVLHTSGSTGMPKPIVLSQRSVTAIDALLRPEFSMTNTASFRNCIVFLPFPLFHLGGIAFLVLGMYAEMTIVFPTLGPLTAQVVDTVHLVTKPQISVLPPSILADIAANPDFLDRLRSVPLVVYGGGPIPEAVGKEVALRTHLQSGFGSTEAGWYVLDILPPQDWQYLKFNPAMGHEMHHYADDLYEIRLHRNSELKDFQAIFATFTDIDTYNTKDLFSKHPSKKDLWMFRGRLDDIIVYSTGEKMNPTSMEGVINGHRDVGGALIYGQGRFQSALLLEPRHSFIQEDDEALLTKKIWPTIQEANSLSPNFGRIVKEMILYTIPRKPLPRAGKGTIQRRMAYELYKDELDALYARFDNSSRNSHREETANKSKPDLILDVVRSLEGFEDFDLHTNLYEHGIDSHQVSILFNRLKNIVPQLGVPVDIVTKPMIYESATVGQLVNRLLSDVSELKTSAEYMQEIFTAYTEELSVTARQPETSTRRLRTVLLTGSTGTLGKHLLHQLLSDPEVETIYCLGRGEDLESRQRRTMKENGLEADFDDQRVVFYQGNFSKPYLGLSLSTYHELLNAVTFIVHNAWMVDFNQSLDRIASTHIKGLKQLLQFSTQSKYGATLFFISSVSSVSSWQPDPSGTVIVPEKVSRSWSDAAETGYSQSKNIAERIIDSACRLTKTSAAICRVGQIAGPTTKHGCWSKQEWLPTLVASSKYLGKIPVDLSSLELVDWVPVDLVASAVLTLCKHPASSNEPNVYHIVNPHKTTWSDLLPTIQDTLGLESVPSSSWLQLLLESSRSSTDVDQNPGLKLIDFFNRALDGRVKQTPITFVMDQTIQACPEITRIGPVNEHLMRLWLEQWSY